MMHQMHSQLPVHSRWLPSRYRYSRFRSSFDYRFDNRSPISSFFYSSFLQPRCLSYRDILSFLHAIFSNELHCASPGSNSVSNHFSETFDAIYTRIYLSYDTPIYHLSIFHSVPFHRPVFQKYTIIL